MHLFLLNSRTLTFPICQTAFGQDVSWQDPEAPPPNHKISFKRALHLMSVDVVFKIAFSERVLGLTKRTRGVRDAFHELRVRERLVRHAELLDFRGS